MKRILGGYYFFIRVFLFLLVNVLAFESSLASVFTIPSGTTQNVSSYSIAAGDVLVIQGTLIVAGNFDNQGRLENYNTLNVGGDFRNGTSGIIVNTGTITVKGNWFDDNAGKYGVIYGTVILDNSSSVQRIDNNSKGNILFANLSVKGSQKDLVGNVVIKNILDLSAIIDATASSDTLAIDSAGSIINYSSSAYVKGAMFRKGRHGSGIDNASMIFPISDNNGNYRPLMLSNQPLSTGKKWMLKAEAVGGSFGGGSINPPQSLMTKRYWKLDLVQTEGNFSGGTNITLYYTSSDLSSSRSPSSMTVASRAGSSPSGAFASLGTLGYTSGSYLSVTSSSKMTFTKTTSSYMALASNSCTPVTGTLDVSPNDSLCAGVPATFSIIQSSALFDSVVYYKNMIFARKGIKGTTYTINNPADGDQVSAVIWKSGCPSSTNSITLKVGSKINANLGNDVMICNKSITLDAGTYSIPVKYYWNTKATTQKITVSSPGIYSVLVYNFLCYDTDSIEILPKKNMVTPVITVGTVTASSVEFKWNSDVNAKNYQFSTDSASWTNDTDFKATIGSLAPSTNICGWVRFINNCDTLVSRKACAITLANCKITYVKPKDTAVCAAAGSTVAVTLSLKSINPPNATIAWMGNTAVAAGPYTIGINKDTTVRLRIFDPGISGCYRDDSVKINFIPVSDAGWSGLNPSYCTASYSSVLVPNQSGGTFAGPGVAYNYTTGQWFFKPSVAGPGTFTITYTICSVTTSKTTTVQAAPCVTSVVTDSTGSAIQSPEGIFTDCDGQIYSSNGQNQVITLIDTLGHVSVIAGDSNNAGYVDGPATAGAKIFGPVGITVGPDGTVYFVDSQNQAVRMVKNGVVATLAGAPPPVAISGDAPSVIGVTVPGSSARFKRPYGVAMNSTYTKLYVSDLTNKKIKEIDLTPPYNVRTIINSSAGLDAPSHLSADQNYLYIADQNVNGIFRYEFSTGITKLYAGGTLGNVLGFTDAVPPASFYQPSGVSVNCDGNLYVADQGNNSIKLVDPNTFAPRVNVSNFAGSNSTVQSSSDVDGPPSLARFSKPTAVSVFVKGFIDIADTGNDKIKRLSIQDYSQRPWDKLQKDFSYCTYDKPDTLTPPCGGVYSGPGIVSSGSVVKFDPAVAGTGVHTLVYVYTTGYCVETRTQVVTVNPKPLPDLNNTDTLVCDNLFGAYQLDAGAGFATYQWFKDGVEDKSSVIRYFTIKSPGKYLVQVTSTEGCVGTDVLDIKSTPSPTVTITSPDDSLCYGGFTTLTASAQIAAPSSISSYFWNTGKVGNTTTANASGDYIVRAVATNGCESSASFRVIIRNAPDICMTAASMKGIDLGYGTYGVGTLAGSLSGTAGNTNGKGVSARFTALWDVYLDKTGQYLYITQEGNQNNIRRIRLSDTLVTNFAGTASSGAYTNSTLSSSAFNHPYGIVENSAGQLLVADRRNQSLRVLDSMLGIANTFAGYSGPLSPGISGWKDGKDTTARFYDPFDLAQDGFGNIFVTDYSNGLIRKVTPQGIVSTIAGDTLFSTYTSKDGKSYKAAFSQPLGIELDEMGSLYVTDRQTGALRKISLDTVVTTVASGFTSPWNIVTDKKGNIYVSDAGANMVKKVDRKGNITPLPFINIPRGITIDPVTENLYVAEYGANRIRTIVKNKTVVICAGDSVKINASCSAAASYSWLPATGLNSSSIASPVANPASTTVYTLTVTDASGCTNTDSITILVNPKPVASAGTDKIMCMGDSVQIGATALANHSYKWSPSISAKKDTLSNPFVSPGITTSYILAVKDKTSGCMNSDTVKVSVNAIPVASAGPARTICLKDSVQIGIAATGNTYLWTPSTGLSAVNKADPYAKPLVTTKYVLTVTTPSGCVKKDSVIITVNPLPLAVAGTDTVMCQGGSKKMGALPVANYSYSWTPVTGLNPVAGNTANPVAAPAITTSYTLTVKNLTTGCANKDTAVITVNPVPLADAGPDKVLCAGDSVVTGTAGVTGVTYTWSPSAGLKDAAKPVTNASPAATTQYTLTAALATGCFKKDSVIITVNPKPLANAGTDTTMCQNASKQMGVSGNPSYTYSWLPVTGLTPGGNISNPVARPASTTTYTLTVTIPATGCFRKDSALITIKPIPAANAGADRTICAEDIITIGTAASGDTYAWSPAAGLNNPSLASPKANPLVTTEYILTVTGASGCFKKDTVLITVNPKPVASFTAGTACAQDTIRFKDNSSPAGSLTYSWDFGDLTSAASQNPLHTYQSSGTFSTRLIVASSSGCKDTMISPVTVNVKPVAAFTAAIPCSGPVVFTDNSGSIAASSWNFGDGNLGTGSPSDQHTYASAGTYNVQLITTNSAGCKDTLQKAVTISTLSLDAGKDTVVCAGTNALLTAKASGGSGTYTYQWTGPAVVTIDTPSDMSTSVTAPPSAILRKIYVQVTDAGCSVKDSVLIEVAFLPGIDGGNSPLEVCYGQTLTLYPSASSAAGIKSMAWSPSTGLQNADPENQIVQPLDDISYVVTAIDNNNCLNRDTVEITVNPLPNVKITQSRSMGCNGTPVKLSVPFSNNSNTIRWYDITSGTTLIGTNTLTATAPAEGTYKVVITNAKGCADSSSLFVDFIQPPGGTVSVKAADSNCINQPVLLIVQGATGDSLLYKWSTIRQNNLTTPANDTTGYIPDPSDVSPLSFKVEVYNSCDTLEANKSVRLDPAPQGGFTATPVPGFVLDTIYFKNISDTALYRINQWTWNFKDGTTAIDFNPGHVFADPGAYMVDLMMTNKFGCSNTFSGEVRILGYNVFVPNVFSPSAANPENRSCKVYGTKISPDGFSFKIFNRWGDLVYETANFTEANTVGWDGTDMHKEVQSMGVYTYSLKALHMDGRPIDKTGTVTLVR